MPSQQRVGEVGHPELVAGRSREIALDEVGPPRRVLVGDRRAPRLPAPFRALDAVLAHQPLDPAATDLFALA
jgi:hypothetical protein